MGEENIDDVVLDGEYLQMAKVKKYYIHPADWIDGNVTNFDCRRRPLFEPNATCKEVQVGMTPKPNRAWPSLSESNDGARAASVSPPSFSRQVSE